MLRRGGVCWLSEFCSLFPHQSLLDSYAANVYWRAHTHRHARTHIHTHICTHSHTHTRARAITHTRACARTMRTLAYLHVSTWLIARWSLWTKAKKQIGWRCLDVTCSFIALKSTASCMLRRVEGGQVVRTSKGWTVHCLLVCFKLKSTPSLNWPTVLPTFSSDASPRPKAPGDDSLLVIEAATRVSVPQGPPSCPRPSAYRDSTICSK